jgi:hypothetical protein
MTQPSLATRRQLSSLLFFGTALGAGLSFQYWQHRQHQPPQRPGVEARTAVVPASIRQAPPVEITTADSLAAQRARWQERLRSAEERLATYRSWARYPPDSRPASEHPDRLQPTAPVTRSLPLAGTASPEVRLRLVQDDVTLVGSESTRLRVRCEDRRGALLPCVVLSARALPLSPGTGGTTAPAEVHFSDDGRGGDEVAGDGTLTATLQPAKLGFGSYLGPLRVELALRAGSAKAGATGETAFVLSYTPEPPAVLTGHVREALEDGSLSLYLGIEVRTAGRYVLAARVDDMRGKSFAFLPWTDELAVGPQEIKLSVFGKLILDAAPAMPLRLRDVDGFLLKEAAAPDREHLPMLAGYLHTTSSYPRTAFADKPWQSAERDRHEQQLATEVADAKSALAKLPPEAN